MALSQPVTGPLSLNGAFVERASANVYNSPQTLITWGSVGARKVLQQAYVGAPSKRGGPRPFSLLLRSQAVAVALSDLVYDSGPCW